MGCPNLAYRENITPLRVLYGAVKTSEKGCAGYYRYGYQGSERDPEMSGGAGYTTYFRALDPRIGRWLTPDPKVFPWQSPYVSMDGNPVALIDPLGDKSVDQKTANSGGAEKGDTYKDNNGRVFQNRGEGLGWQEITPPSATANTPANNGFRNIAGQTQDGKSWMQIIVDWIRDHDPVIYGYTIIDYSAQAEEYRRSFKEHQIFSLPGVPYGYLDKSIMFSYPGHGKIGRGVTFNTNMASSADKAASMIDNAISRPAVNVATDNDIIMQVENTNKELMNEGKIVENKSKAANIVEQKKDEIDEVKVISKKSFIDSSNNIYQKVLYSDGKVKYFFGHMFYGGKRELKEDPGVFDE